MLGEDGDDEIWASANGANEIFGGAGDDMILAGVEETGGLTQENFPNLPRRVTITGVTGAGTYERNVNVSKGNLDIHGGDGDDFIIGGVGSNDIYGGKGNDVIYGS